MRGKKTKNGLKIRDVSKMKESEMIQQKTKKMFLLCIAIISGCISAISAIIAENLTYNPIIAEKLTYIPFLGLTFSEPIFLYDIYIFVFLIFLAPALFCGTLWVGINFALEVEPNEEKES